MAVLEILQYPDPKLKKASQPVEVVTEDTVCLIREMVEAMYTARG